MPEVSGFQTNAIAQPVRWTETGGGDFGAPGTGSWENDGAAVDVILLPVRAEEKVRAGMDVDIEARKLIYNGNPITTRQTLDISGTRYNVRSVEPYNVAGFDRIGVAMVVRL